MMRRSTLLLLLSLSSVAVVGATYPTTEAADTPTEAGSATVTVTIVFQCEGTRSVSPWNARIKQGDDIAWVLDASSDVAGIEISKKQRMGRWPFQSELPARATKGEPAVGNNMRPDARGTFPYNIEAMCPAAGDALKRAIITPDLIVE